MGARKLSYYQESSFMRVVHLNECARSYRYGFQGQEKDDEIKGEGNSYAYTFRFYDPRLGRFLSVDPLTDKYPHYTPYSYCGNRVIDRVEIEGLEDAWYMWFLPSGLERTMNGEYHPLTEMVFSSANPESLNPYPMGTPDCYNGYIPTEADAFRSYNYEFCKSSTVAAKGYTNAYIEAAQFMVEEYVGNIGGAGASRVIGKVITRPVTQIGSKLTGKLISESSELVIDKSVAKSTTIVAEVIEIPRAPAGGIYDVATDKFYKGGQFMPGRSKITYNAVQTIDQAPTVLDQFTGPLTPSPNYSGMTLKNAIATGSGLATLGVLNEIASSTSSAATLQNATTSTVSASNSTSGATSTNTASSRPAKGIQARKALAAKLSTN